MLTKPAPPRPELNALLERARQAPPMTWAQRREQRISFVYGQMMDCAPHITREDVEAAHDAMYGRPGDA
jgi:hypothetical protein